MLASNALMFPTSGVFRISKGGGGKFSLATSAHTKGGQPKFSNFLVCQRIFLAKWGGGGRAWPNAPPPPKYASVSNGHGRLIWPKFGEVVAESSQNTTLTKIPADEANVPGGPTA